MHFEGETETDTIICILEIKVTFMTVQMYFLCMFYNTGFICLLFLAFNRLYNCVRDFQKMFAHFDYYCAFIGQICDCSHKMSNSSLNNIFAVCFLDGIFRNAIAWFGHRSMTSKTIGRLCIRYNQLNFPKNLLFVLLLCSVHCVYRHIDHMHKFFTTVTKQAP